MNDIVDRLHAPSKRVQYKEGAHEFLVGFHETLRKSLPEASEMEREIRKTVAAAKPDYSERHLRPPESAFINGQVIPTLAKQIVSFAQLTPNDARDALLSEYHPSLNGLSSGSPAHTLKHPFTKLMSVSSEAVYARWMEPDKALVQSCPDFALRSPFPHKIVFEGKYFSTGSLPYAKRVLVSDIYQAFFYRGLPCADRTNRGRAEWEYDYACLLAYDA